MKQSFDQDVMQDLAADASVSDQDALGAEGFEDTGDDALDAADEDLGDEESFEEGESLDEDLGDEDLGDDHECADCADDFGDGAADLGEGLDEGDSFGGDELELAVADAMDADDGDAFLRNILGCVARVARRPAPRGARPVAARRVGQVLQRALSQGRGEASAFEALADAFADSGEDLDAALPVLGAMAARAAVRPLLRRGARLPRPVRRALVRTATAVGRTLLRRAPSAVRALPRLARSVARIARRRRLAPAAVAPALRRVAAQVVGQPTLLRRLVRQPPGVATPAPARRHAPGGARRLLLSGPVEIFIRPVRRGV